MPPTPSNNKQLTNHLKPSVEEKLQYAINHNDANIETKQFGQRNGLQHVVTFDGELYQYSPKKDMPTLLTTKLTKSTKTNPFEPTPEIQQIYQRVRLQHS